MLDGVQRISASVFATLQSLIYDREITLFDGTRLVHHERYAAMRAKASEKQLAEKRIFPVHPSFRIIGAIFAFKFSFSYYTTTPLLFCSIGRINICLCSTRNAADAKEAMAIV